MKYIDVFNGDADGICALHQLRLATPQPQARLITGVKRDVLLLQQILTVENAQVTVLDISFDRNRNAVERLLQQNNQITYIDHHFSGDLPFSPQLTTHIDPHPETCTSLIADSLLQGRFALWAIAGAFGDNLDEVAQEKATQLRLSEQQVTQLREIGHLLNYNGYGITLEDLHIPPAELFLEVHAYRDPFDFYRQSTTLASLQEGYAQDMEYAQNLGPLQDAQTGRVYQLPNAAWARRIVGVFSNQLARQAPEKAHATLLVNDDGTYRVSVRAPLVNRTGADTLCRLFPTGGGRAAAAGINSLPEDQMDHFLSVFIQHF